MARFHMDSLVTKTKRKDVRKALESLPPELDGIYDRAIERIEGQGKDYSDLAKRVLMWVSNAFCPLSPVELQSAIAVQPGMTELDDEDLDDQDLTASVCTGLVVLDAETDTLRFVRKFYPCSCFQNCNIRLDRSVLVRASCWSMFFLKPNLAICASSEYQVQRPIKLALL